MIGRAGSVVAGPAARYPIRASAAPFTIASADAYEWRLS